MGCCKKCSGMCAWILIVLGVLFLMKDLGIWTWWNVSWWTALILLMGVGMLGAKSCSSCQIEGKKKK